MTLLERDGTRKAANTYLNHRPPRALLVIQLSFTANTDDGGVVGG